MSFLKQALASVLLIGAVIVLSALFLPATHPMLERLGLLERLDRIGLVGGAEAGSPEARGGGFSGGPALVVASEAAREVQRDTVTAIGTARGARSVVLAPEVTGRVVSVAVASGEFVRAGQTVIELDSEAARIALDRAALVLRDAEATRARIERLRTTGSASELQMQEAELAVQTARLQLREAEFDLARHSVSAPIDGWVGILAVEAGNQVAANEEITRIEDRTGLIVDFRVPERIVSRLRVGDAVSASPLADTGAVLAGRLSALDNRVDEASRTLQVQAEIENREDGMRPGMAFLMTLEFTGAEYPTVDPLAIQWGADGAFVWAVRDGKAERLAVRILQRNSDKVLVTGEFREGDLIVTEGVQGLRPGREVEVVGGAAGTKS
jgi:RND family efflux transporter MFP subunit